MQLRREQNPKRWAGDRVVLQPMTPGVIFDAATRNLKSNVSDVYVSGASKVSDGVYSLPVGYDTGAV